MNSINTNAIVIHGARQHNLKNVTLSLPKGKLIVFTGLSGSGKSSLAFDTLHAEAQRRYVESLSPYARQVLGQASRPDVDRIDGLTPSIAVAQFAGSGHPRSTVGTVTDTYDYLRLLFGKLSRPVCPRCGHPVQALTVQEMVDQLVQLPSGSRLLILAPITANGQSWTTALERAQRSGFIRVRIDSSVQLLEQVVSGKDLAIERAELVIDRLQLRSAAASQEELTSRLADSLETALHAGSHHIIALVDDVRELHFTDRWLCPYCDIALPDRDPHLFSFNHPAGACSDCDGLGWHLEFDLGLVIPDQSLSLEEGAIAPWGAIEDTSLRNNLLRAVATHFGESAGKPLEEWAPHAYEALVHGPEPPLSLRIPYVDSEAKTTRTTFTFRGILDLLRRQYREAHIPTLRAHLERYMGEHPCSSCNSERLRVEARAYHLHDRSIGELALMPFAALTIWLSALRSLFTAEASTHRQQALIGLPILDELEQRIAILLDLGLGHLHCHRAFTTLSRGEAQRCRLAAQLAQPLSGLLYVLDEPTQGLHPSECSTLLQAVLRLRDQENTVIVVEHDEIFMRAADWIVDFGPGAGHQGGRVLATGPLSEFIHNSTSLTARFLRGDLRIEKLPHPAQLGPALTIRHASLHNLRDLDVDIPTGCLIAVAGVSGAGKSTLVFDILRRAAEAAITGISQAVPAHVDGLTQFRRLVHSHQSAAIRSSRSMPATLTGVFTPIRELFAQTPEARIRGYGSGRFSFNMPGGRCEACEGLGMQTIDLQFLPAVEAVCDICHGKRYNRETLEVRYHGLSIAGVLALNVEEACDLFRTIPQIAQRLEPLRAIGLGYLPLGQPAATLSGGEAERLRLATELARKGDGKTLYLFDEPTSGLHFADVHRLLDVLAELVRRGETVIVIEHHRDILKAAHWLIELGPGSGPAGGQVIATGPPDVVAANPASRIGVYLR
ncbi:MAG: excinuclease ABC subunit UvrA [Chloroflexi bacterium]|nr:excinuclease ABC subunit UvrA [Chloroflexota bacterium]